MNRYLAKVFTSKKEFGNPALVFLSSEERSVTELKKIAIKSKYLTAFVFPLENEKYELKFFSGKNESSLCVHAALAAVFVLNKVTNKRKFLFKIKKSEYEAFLKDSQVFLKLKKPIAKLQEVDKNKIARLLSLSSKDILSTFPIQAVSVGKYKLIVPIKSLEILLKIKPRNKKIVDYCKKNDIEGFYPFVDQAKDNNCDYHARHFNPLTLDKEDPVCGVGAGALAGYLKKNKVDRKMKFCVEMGHATNQPGQITVDANNGIKVGGNVVIV